MPDGIPIMNPKRAPFEDRKENESKPKTTIPLKIFPVENNILELMYFMSNVLTIKNTS